MTYEMYIQSSSLNFHVVKVQGLDKRFKTSTLQRTLSKLPTPIPPTPPHPLPLLFQPPDIHYSKSNVL